MNNHCFPYPLAPFRKFVWMLTFTLLVLCFLPLHTQAQSGKSGKNTSVFRASAVKINISPDVPKQLLGYGARLSTGIHDSIYHRIVALDDGETQFFLVSTEICMMSPSEYDRVAIQVKKKLGIDPVNFWWTVTHTHSAPEIGVPGMGEVFLGDRYKHPVDTAYTAFVEQSLIEGIREARNKLKPAKLGTGWGYARANINRRGIDVNGKASLGLNPDGPVDRRIGLIKIEDVNGDLIALLANYALHGTVLGPPFKQISGDAPGIVSTYTEQQLGAPVLFINGAAGNMAPIYSVYPTPEAGHLGEFRVLLGDKIIDASKRIAQMTDSVRLVTGSLTVETPRKPSISWTEDLKKYATPAGKDQPMVRLPLRFLKINSDVAIWSAPLELFCEISNEIRERSPFPFTFYFGYTNGWLGYLPTADAWKNGGYEVEVVSPFTTDAESDVRNAVLGYLEGELNNPSSKRNKK